MSAHRGLAVFFFVVYTLASALSWAVYQTVFQHWSFAVVSAVCVPMAYWSQRVMRGKD